MYVHVDVKYKKFIAVIRFSEGEIYHMQLNAFNCIHAV